MFPSDVGGVSACGSAWEQGASVGCRICRSRGFVGAVKPIDAGSACGHVLLGESLLGLGMRQCKRMCMLLSSGRLSKRSLARALPGVEFRTVGDGSWETEVRDGCWELDILAKSVEEGWCGVGCEA